jgi:predicted  nucleic acid-binding Zn-ribbon protein
LTTPDLSQNQQDRPTETELARRMRAIEKRERQLDQALAAVSAQREQLAAIQADYERRRKGLIERAREVQAERERLHAERAEMIAGILSQNPPLH